MSALTGLDVERAPAAAGPPDPAAVEVSVVIPCLNEAETLGACVAKAHEALRVAGIRGEVIVADNGSTDGSPEIAQRLGARLVIVTPRGYGNALMGGIGAARGTYVIMGDADESYDFGEIPAFVKKLREGFDLVQGCRFPSGGGRIIPRAMPSLHRWVGNPVLSRLTQWMFRSQVHDVYCGMRGFTRQLYSQLDQRCTGMEFAVEMLVKASLHSARIAEIPITLYPDGRLSHPPHLRTLRDGWRTVTFLLVYSPRWLFLIPGAILILLGVAGYIVAMPGVPRLGINFDAHTLLVASLAILLGYQSILFAVYAKTFAVAEGLLPEDVRLSRFLRVVTLERGLVGGIILFAFGVTLLLIAVNQWRVADFGNLDYAHTMRWVIPGVTATALGFQTMLSSFFVSILRMRRR